MENNTNQDIITLNLDDSNRLTVYLHGATITSWISDNKEILFVSKRSVFDNKKAIRGGIPVVFPNFGPWDNNRPQHGFARTKKWSVKEAVNKSTDSVSISLWLKDDEETRKLWNYNFELIYDIKLTKNNLETTLTVKNTGQETFDFTSLLHTYFKLNDIQKVRINGLSQLEYTDKVKNGAKFIDSNDFINITSETDRIYVSTPDTHTINLDENSTNILTLKKVNLPDTVVWNPWIEKSRAMADFDDQEYKEMVCVEAGYVDQRRNLNPNESFSMSQTITH